ncbi:MAG: signal recognition particle-docking protein FtsY [Syntrophobacteraceae bacterium]|nr:signal recognition particle-docking protein FtsY [Syntrophobacteraceae bacterium]
MIRWFKRKKEKGAQGLDDTPAGKAGEAQEPVEQETSIAPPAPPVEEISPEEGKSPDDLPLDEQEGLEEKTADVVEEENEEELEETAPRKGFFKRFRSRLKGQEEEESSFTEEPDKAEGSPELKTWAEAPPSPVEEIAPEAQTGPTPGAEELESLVPGYHEPPEELPPGEREAPEEYSLEQEEEEDGDHPGETVPRKSFFKRLRSRLKGTREKFAHRIDRLVLGRKVIDDDLLDELEEILITSDLGVKTTTMLLGKVADKVKRKELSDPARLREQIREEIRSTLAIDAPPLDYRAHKPLVILIVGVNGTGKTTTTGKLASQLKKQGLKPMLVACDTFRAAAVEQLSIWGERTGVPVVKQKSGSDPSAVAFDALDAAVSRDIDVVLMDTAGRMHTKVNLMEELKKIHRVIDKKMAGAPHEIFLVLDASTGQNALSQAKLFKEGIGLTGLIVTKLDGTAKGGIIAAICEELQVPVRYIGIGESIEDLRAFDAEEFTNALF